MAQAAAPKKPLTKTELLSNIAAAIDVPKNQVAAVLEALAAEIEEEPRQQGRGRDHDPRTAEDREEEGPRPACPEGRSEPVQAR